MIVLEALDELRTVHPDHTARHELSDRGHFLIYPDLPPMGPVPLAMFDLEARLADMDAARVDRQVIAVPPPQLLYHLPPGVGADFARVQNDAAVRVTKRSPDRLHVFGTLPLQHPAAAVGEIERLAGESRVRGVQIGTNVAGANLDDAALDPVWSALAEARLPVWVHPDQRTVAGADRLRSYYLGNLIGNPHETTLAIACLIFGGVLQRHPALRIGFVHGGGFAPYQLGRWDHGWRCRPEVHAAIDQPPSEYFRRMYFDTLTHDRDALEFLGRRVGWRHVVLGSDYPFDMAAARPVDGIDALGLSETDRCAVLSGNAEEFLRPTWATG
jgi:aminocarboxymuconate-semialdehyde decarboxylase